MTSNFPFLRTKPELSAAAISSSIQPGHSLKVSKSSVPLNLRTQQSVFHSPVPVC